MLVSNLFFALGCISTLGAIVVAVMIGAELASSRANKSSADEAGRFAELLCEAEKIIASYKQEVAALRNQVSQIDRLKESVEFWKGFGQRMASEYRIEGLTALSTFNGIPVVDIPPYDIEFERSMGM